MTTIFRKELKDILRWIPLGIIVIGFLCWQNVPRYIHDCYYVSSTIANGIIIGSSLFALALGLLQSLFDLRTDSRAFLLHRPIDVRNIFRGKVAAGFVAHTIAWTIPLSITAMYLESVGPEKLPVSWSNVLLAAVYAVVSFLFHPAAMWMSCREARWVGTKCLPLALPLIACLAAVGFRELPDWLTLLLSVTTGLAAALIIVAAARHAFSHQTFLPAPVSAESSSWWNSIGLAVASGMVATTTILFVVSLFIYRDHTLPTKARRLTAAASGQLWEIQETWKSPRTWEHEPIHRAGRLLTGEQVSEAFVDLDEGWKEETLVTLDLAFTPRHSILLGEYEYLSSTASKQSGGAQSLFTRNGRIHLYGDYQAWEGTVTPQGIFEPNETPQGAFRNLRALDHYQGAQGYRATIGGQRLLADDDGIYQLDIDAGQLRKLSDLASISTTITLPTDNSPAAVLWARGDTSVHRFSMRPMTEDQTLPSIDSEIVKATHRYPLSNVEITPNGEWRIDWVSRPKKTSLLVASNDANGTVCVASPNTAFGTWQYRFGMADGSLGEIGDVPDIETAVPGNDLEAYFVPPGLLVGFAIVMSFAEPAAYQAMGADNLSWILIALHALLGGAEAFLLARSRVQSKSSLVTWLILGLLFSASAWLAVIAIYPRQIFESCTGCQRRRRVDMDRCEHCGADWDAPDRDGIELIGLGDLSLAEVSQTS